MESLAAAADAAARDGSFFAHQRPLGAGVYRATAEVRQEGKAPVFATASAAGRRGRHRDGRSAPQRSSAPAHRGGVGQGGSSRPATSRHCPDNSVPRSRPRSSSRAAICGTTAGRSPRSCCCWLPSGCCAVSGECDDLPAPGGLPGAHVRRRCPGAARARNGMRSSFPAPPARLRTHSNTRPGPGR